MHMIHVTMFSIYRYDFFSPKRWIELNWEISRMIYELTSVESKNIPAFTKSGWIELRFHLRNLAEFAIFCLNRPPLNFSLLAEKTDS